MASETSIQSDIIDYINSLPQGRAENVSGNAQQSGRADVNACIRGRLFKIEVKTEDTEYGREGASTKQRLYLEKWARAGAISCVVYSVEDVKWVIQRHYFDVEVEIKELRNSFNFQMTPKYDKFNVSGRGKWYDVQNKRWVDISY